MKETLEMRFFLKLTCTVFNTEFFINLISVFFCFKNTSHDVITEEEENGPILSDEELGTHQSEVKEGDPVSGNAADDDDDVFDWY